MRKLFIIFVVIVVVFLTIIGGGLYWLKRSADSCWKYEAEQAFHNYGIYNNFSEILKAATSTDREIIKKTPNLIEIIESDPNGCSLGGNGQTVLKFYFDDKKKLTKIQVYRNYITDEANYHMELIQERIY